MLGIILNKKQHYAEVALSLLVVMICVSLQVYYPLSKVAFIVIVLWGMGELVFRFEKELLKQSLTFSSPFVIFALVTVALQLLQPSYDLTQTKLDTQIRFLYALPIFYLALRYRLNQTFFWYGIAFGAIASGLYAINEVVSVNDGSIVVTGRAKGSSYEIMFGDISLLFAVLSYLGLKQLRDRSRISNIIFILALLLGTVASFLSGSRGGWVSIPFILIFVSYLYLVKYKVSILKVSIGVIVSLVFIVMLINIFSLKERALKPVYDIKQTFTGEYVDTPTGQRLEMWRASAMMIEKAPWIGTGLGSYHYLLNELINSHKIAQQIHFHMEPHNDILSVWVSRGMVGIIFMLAMFLVPVYRIYTHVTMHNNSDINVSTAAIITAIMALIFGLTDAMTVDKFFIAVYIILMAGFVSLGSFKGMNDEKE